MTMAAAAAAVAMFGAFFEKFGIDFAIFFCNKPHQARETKASLGGGGIQWRRSGVSTSNCSNDDDGDRGVFFVFFFVVIEAGPAVLRQAVCKLAGSCRNDEDGRQNR